MNQVEGDKSERKTADAGSVEVGGGTIDLGKIEISNRFAELEEDEGEEEDIPSMGGGAKTRKHRARRK